MMGKRSVARPVSHNETQQTPEVTVLNIGMTRLADEWTPSQAEALAMASRMIRAAETFLIGTRHTGCMPDETDFAIIEDLLLGIREHVQHARSTTRQTETEAGQVVDMIDGLRRSLSRGGSK
jgi:hypothetical protein